MDIAIWIVSLSALAVSIAALCKSVQAGRNKN